MLAYHFARAEVWDTALDYLLKAAAKATQAFATREALALYDQAEDVVRQCGRRRSPRPVCRFTRPGLICTSCAVTSSAPTPSGNAPALARQTGAQVSEGMALVGMGTASYLEHKFDQALAEAQQAIVVAETLGAQLVLTRLTSPSVMSLN